MRKFLWLMEAVRSHLPFRFWHQEMTEQSSQLMEAVRSQLPFRFRHQEMTDQSSQLMEAVRSRLPFRFRGHRKFCRHERLRAGGGA